MSDSTSNPAPASTPDPARPAAAGASAATNVSDPLASLYRMSRTAGLGSQEYVEVNATSVIALLLGLASAAAVFGPLLLIVPAIAIVVSLVALHQIKNSAGTQTGKGLAIFGIVLAILFGAVVGGQTLRDRSILKQEKGQIIALIEDLGKKISADDLDGAYNLFSDRFQQTTRKEDFAGFWTMTKSSSLYGAVQSTASTGLLEVKIDSGTGARLAEGQIIIRLEKMEVRPVGTFRKVGDKWVIETINIPFRADTSR